jgi:hypothetical protein
VPSRQPTQKNGPASKPSCGHCSYPRGARADRKRLPGAAPPNSAGYHGGTVRCSECDLSEGVGVLRLVLFPKRPHTRHAVVRGAHQNHVNKTQISPGHFTRRGRERPVSDAGPVGLHVEPELSVFAIAVMPLHRGVWRLCEHRHGKCGVDDGYVRHSPGSDGVHDAPERRLATVDASDAA